MSPTASQDKGGDGNSERGFSSFLLLGWLAATGSLLAASGLVELAIRLMLFAFLWVVCRLPPWRGVSLQRLLRGLILASLATLPLLALASWWALHDARDAEGLEVYVYAQAAIAALALALLFFALLHVFRRWPVGEWNGRPLWMPASRTCVFLLLSIPILNPAFLDLNKPVGAVEANAAIAMIVLLGAVIWRWKVRELLRTGWGMWGAWNSQVVVVGIGMAWWLDQIWQVQTRSLPRLVLSAPVLWPGIWLILAAVELLVLSLLWRSRAFSWAADPVPGWLRILVATALLASLAMHRPALALCFAILAAWLDLPLREVDATQAAEGLPR